MVSDCIVTFPPKREILASAVRGALSLPDPWLLHCETEIADLHPSASRPKDKQWNGSLAGWGRNRRLSKDYELLPATGEARMHLDMCHLMVRRLAS